MLSYQAFVAKHATKYRGLSAAAKRTRYQQYLVSQRGGGSSGPRPKQQRQRRAQRSARRPRRRQTRLSFGGGGSLGPFARLYANPFTADTVGLPVFPSPPSSKVTAWARGSFTIGTAGIGFIAGTPATCSDSLQLYTSGSTFAGTQVGAATGVSNFGLTNLPVAAAGLGDTGLKARVAMMAMRVRYAGTELNKGGIMYPYVSPTHTSITGYGEVNFAGQEAFHTVPVSRNWVTVLWTPIHRTELDYYHTQVPPTHVHDDDPSQSLTMCILAKSSAGNVFEYEVIEHIEYTGVGNTSGMTRTANPTPTPGIADRIDTLQQPAFAIRDTPTPLERASRVAGSVGREVLRGFLGSAARRNFQPALRDEF